MNSEASNRLAFINFYPNSTQNMRGCQQFTSLHPALHVKGRKMARFDLPESSEGQSGAGDGNEILWNMWR